jgi:hypothetical protein
MSSLNDRVNELIGNRRVPDIDWIQREWIPALESGTYTQTDAVLHNDKGFCCLGVACDLLPDVTWSASMDDIFLGYRSVRNGIFDDDVVELPKFVRHRLGLGSNWIDLPPGTALTNLLSMDDISRLNIPSGSTYVPLAKMNDTGWTFAKIADTLRTVVAMWRAYERSMA